MKEPSDSKSEHAEGALGRKHHGFKKKAGKHKKPQSKGNCFFKGIAFCIGRKGPELYIKALERLGLYVGTQFQNGSDVKKCLLLLVTHN